LVTASAPPLQLRFRYPGILAHNLYGLPPNRADCYGDPEAGPDGGQAMTFNQSQAVWELCRQGLPLLADDAEEHWENGEPFQIDLPVKLPREFMHLIDCCNWEAEQAAAGGLH
jgi:hypothetical protein